MVILSMKSLISKMIHCPPFRQKNTKLITYILYSFLQFLGLNIFWQYRFTVKVAPKNVDGQV